MQLLRDNLTVNTVIRVETSCSPVDMQSNPLLAACDHDLFHNRVTFNFEVMTLFFSMSERTFACNSTSAKIVSQFVDLLMA